MKKAICIIFAAVLLCGCGAPVVETTTPSPTETMKNEVNVSDTMPVVEETPALEKFVALPVNVKDNKKFLRQLNIETDVDFQTEMGTPIAELISSEDTAYYVEFNPDRMAGLPADRPNMPMYRWYINGSNANIISEVVIEFDLYETISPLHPTLFGYDMGYFLTLQYARTVRLDPIGQQIQLKGNMFSLDVPELGEELRKYAKQDGTHVTITIPYSEFQSSAKDLTLQFLPGTTFANLSIKLWGSDKLNENIVNEISQVIYRPEHDLLSEILVLAGMTKDAWGFPDYNGQIIGDVESAIHRDEGPGLIINSDGSINMPVSLYDLGEYAGEVKGKYAVIPEGVIPAFATLSSYAFLSNIQDDIELEKQYKRNLADFVFQNLMDETGQFYGIYDIAQGKTVATNRKSPALPILSSMCGLIWDTPNTEILSDKEIKPIVNSIIANDIIRVADKLYYAPHGISGDGVMNLSLSDFYISASLLSKLADYAAVEGSLDDEYGVVMLLEGYLNSLKLVVEGQEQNETRLVSSDLKVIFMDGGKSYELQPSDTFDINDSFFLNFDLIGAMSDDFHGGPFSKLAFNKTNQSIAGKLSISKDGTLNETQKGYIRECERQYAEIYNMYEIQTTLYECFFHIYSFLQLQPIETAFAPQYNVHTGEMIEAPTEMLYPQFRNTIAPMLRRIGTPATLMNYSRLEGVFNDETELVETCKALAPYFGEWMGTNVFRSSGLDSTNPDLYAENAFDIWGFDSLYSLNFDKTVVSSSAPLYDSMGHSFGREGWKEYTMRMLNENIQNEAEHVMPDDEFPLFYDHLPKEEIIN